MSTEREIEVEVDLTHVPVDDQPLVQDVCALLAALRRDLPVPSIAVTVTGKIYSVTASFPRGVLVEVSKSELDTVSDVNPLRVPCVSVLSDGSQVHVKARVSSMDHPVTVTDTARVRVLKKRRWVGN